MELKESIRASFKERGVTSTLGIFSEVLEEERESLRAISSAINGKASPVAVEKSKAKYANVPQSVLGYLMGLHEVKTHQGISARLRSARRRKDHPNLDALEEAAKIRRAELNARGKGRRR